MRIRETSEGEPLMRCRKQEDGVKTGGLSNFQDKSRPLARRAYGSERGACLLPGPPGIEVVLAANGKEALKQLDVAGPDLVVLDIVMPVMDGMETLGRIVREHRDVPIILNTAYSSYKDDFMSWGAEAYVVKSADLGS